MRDEADPSHLAQRWPGSCYPSNLLLRHPAGFICALVLMPCTPHIGSKAASAGPLLSPFEGYGNSATHPRIAGICRQQKRRAAVRSVTPPDWQRRCEASLAQRDQTRTARAAQGVGIIGDIHAEQLEFPAPLGCRAVSLDVLGCDVVQMR